MVGNAYVHLPIPSCSLIWFSAIGKVHQSPSAKNVPPARFLNADIRVQHSLFGLLNENIGQSVGLSDIFMVENAGLEPVTSCV